MRISNEDLQQMIDRLTDAVKICYDADSFSEDHEKSYPFACGYSRSAMQATMEKLESFKLLS